MFVFYGALSLNLDWLHRFLRLEEKGLSSSDNKVGGSWSLCLILLAILGLLHLAEKNRAPSSNGNKDEQSELKAEEEEPTGHEIHPDSFDYHKGGEFSGDRTAMYGGECAFCGNLSSTRCSRCKAARYCSVECQIGHWRAGHKFECVETETAEPQASPVHRASKLVKKNRKKSYYASNNVVEWNTSGGEVECEQRNDEYRAIVSSCNIDNGCAVCGGPATTSCSRCKAVRYCSPKCLIEDWTWHKVHCSAGEVNSTKAESPPYESIKIPQNLGEGEDAQLYGQLSLEYYPEGATNTKSLVAISQEPAKKEQGHTAELVRWYDNELEKSRNEIILLRSDRDKWAGRANFAREKYRSFKKEVEQQLFVLKHEKELVLNAERQARNMNQSLSDRLYHLQIAVQASVAEKRKQEEYIQILESKWAQTKKELQEERLHSQWLTVARDRSLETAQVSMAQVEELKQQLQVERENVRKLTENLLENVKTAQSRAAVAEKRLRDLERKIKSTNDKVPVWTDSTGKPAMACAICLSHEKDLAFGCGHMTCRDCGSKVSKCPICREQITSSVRLFPG
ncbi:hypothetical protein L6164_018086 [Bauhinia variegata]|uniref:Uncharacterized protein n=1 Tax=Bauhinia variegata TaxID=167791 RepID=A0ACB9N9W9_BAUVA|nr:hypothetical protein L6164_018086 [Bauhinia variegata]